MNTGIEKGSMIAVCHADWSDVRTEIFRSMVIGVEDAGEIFPYAKDPVFAFILAVPFPSTYEHPPKQVYADRIFRYGDDGSFIFIDALGQPRHLEVELCDCVS